MEIEKLAIEEDELYDSIIKIYDEKSSAENDAKLELIFLKYKEIHRRYSNLAQENNEALKRGLFIQWYSMIEPCYLTGINKIDAESKINILKVIENSIENLDQELKWMLNYYGNWDFTFDINENLPKLENYIKNITDRNFPKTIDRNEMTKRGQMGKYWNSLNVFNK